MIGLSLQIEEYKKFCELKRKETYKKKKELDTLKVKVSKMKETVTTTTVVRVKDVFSSLSRYTLP